MTERLSLQQLRRVVQTTWEEVTRWLEAKPRIFSLPHPEQQILFELGCRLRESIRSLSANNNWDRLYFDSASLTFGPLAVANAVGRRPPIYLDTRQLFGITDSRRSAEAPDIAIAVHVLRSADEIIDVDDDGRPRHQTWMPTSMTSQGWLLEENVRQFDQLSRKGCDGFVFVVYSNAAKRSTAVDRREVASWASWKQLTETLSWASRHFRAK